VTVTDALLGTQPDSARAGEAPYLTDYGEAAMGDAARRFLGLVGGMLIVKTSPTSPTRCCS